MSTQAIRIGVLVTLIGPLARMGEDGLRGVALALDEFGREISGKELQVVKEGTNAVPDTAYYAAEKLIEKDRVDLIIGPLSGNEGMAVRDFAKTKPDHTFLNGTAGTQDMTLRDPAPNFFSFSMDGVQWMAGLGSYAYETLGYKRVATLAHDYSYPHCQVGGFTVEYCRAEGKIAERFWVPLGTSNYSEIINAIPTDIDALFVALAGADAMAFLRQFHESGSQLPLLAGTSTIDPTILNVKDAFSEWIVGTVSAGPFVDDDPSAAWQQFVHAYQAYSPGEQLSPSIFAYCYYVNAKAALLALQTVDGDLSNGQERFRAALASLKFETPTGPVRLDHNRNAIANVFIRSVDQKPDGSLYNKLVKTIPDVNQTLGMPEADYLALGVFDRDNPTCD